jgi:endonuclease/exonuclease/phosphatase family metal-dependent hydrolase
MNRIVRRTAVCAGIAAGLVMACTAALAGILTITEYCPGEVEELELQYRAGETGPVPPRSNPSPGVSVSLLIWNIGYASLDASQDFIMDGGKGVRPASDAIVRRNLAGITEFIAGADCDIVLLQEVDRASRRSYYVDQTAALAGAFAGSSVFAWNFRCLFVPVPVPDCIGRVSSGMLTLNRFVTDEALRVSLPNPFPWPVRIANLKRCLLVSRLPLADSLAELVVVNLHLEAYDSSGGREAQTGAMLELLRREYAKGNYCIAGGDFNQNFPGIDEERFAVRNRDYFVPGVLDPALLDEGWRFVADTQTPTSRLLNEPYSGSPEETQLYIIDGFIISPNVEPVSVTAFDLGFTFSDHNPVKLTALLK